MRIIFRTWLLADMLHRRSGWQAGLRPRLFKLPGAYEFWLGPVLIFINRQRKFRDMLWAK